MAASPTAAGGERGEAGKRKNDCDTQPDTERSVSVKGACPKNCEAWDNCQRFVAKVRARLGRRGRLRYTEIKRSL